jgi:hypothetical protein
MNRRIDLRVCSEATEEVFDCLAELGTEAEPLLDVPVLGLFKAVFGKTANEDLVSHRLRRPKAERRHREYPALEAPIQGAMPGLIGLSTMRMTFGGERVWLSRPVGVARSPRSRCASRLSWPNRQPSCILSRLQ